MTIYLSKVLQTLVFPLGMSMTAFGLGLVLLLFRRTRAGTFVIAFGLLLLWTASVSPIAFWLAHTLERDHPPLSAAETPQADLAIVLGGALSAAAPPRVRPDLGGAADRIWFASQLYREGRVPRLLIVGGNPPWSADAQAEAESIRDILVEWGVPASVIEVETESRSTFENARGARRMLGPTPPERILLVTSGTHMPRALATFSRAGINAIPATAEVFATGGGTFTALDLIPSSGALGLTTIALKEHLGLFVYRLLDRAD